MSEPDKHPQIPFLPDTAPADVFALETLKVEGSIVASVTNREGDAVYVLVRRRVGETHKLHDVVLRYRRSTGLQQVLSEPWREGSDSPILFFDSRGDLYTPAGRYEGPHYRHQTPIIYRAARQHLDALTAPLGQRQSGTDPAKEAETRAADAVKQAVADAVKMAAAQVRTAIVSQDWTYCVMPDDQVLTHCEHTELWPRDASRLAPRNEINERDAASPLYRFDEATRAWSCSGNHFVAWCERVKMGYYKLTLGTAHARFKIGGPDAPLSLRTAHTLKGEALVLIAHVRSESVDYKGRKGWADPSIIIVSKR